MRESTIFYGRARSGGKTAEALRLKAEAEARGCTVITATKEMAEASSAARNKQ